MDKQKRVIHGEFSWQAGYGPFSYSKLQLPRVIQYIQNQEEHHNAITFQEEYVAILKTHSVEYDERYIFKSIE